MSFIRNTWYVVAWDHEIPAEGFLTRTICGIPIVMYRKADGQLIALEDRCCHRGAPLSKGRLEGDCVRCNYHGLKFDTSGQCIDTPWGQKVPPRARVRAFPVVAQHRWVWIWMGTPQQADPSAIPATPWLDHPDWRGRPGYLHYDVNYLLICDNLLDFSHLPFVHPSTLGGGEDYAGTPPKVERMDNGVRVTRWALNTQAPAFVAAVKKWPGLVDRWNIYDFLIPGVLVMDSGNAPTGTGAPQGRRVDAAEFRGCQALTPETENSTHYFFSQPHNFSIDKPEVTDSIHAFILRAFQEDKDMILAQQHSLAMAPDFQMAPMAVDLALAQFRRLVTQRLQQEAAEQAATVG